MWSVFAERFGAKSHDPGCPYQLLWHNINDVKASLESGNLTKTSEDRAIAPAEAPADIDSTLACLFLLLHSRRIPARPLHTENDSVVAAGT